MFMKKICWCTQLSNNDAVLNSKWLHPHGFKMNCFVVCSKFVLLGVQRKVTSPRHFRRFPEPPGNPVPAQPDLRVPQKILLQFQQTMHVNQVNNNALSQILQIAWFKYTPEFELLQI